MRGVRVVLLVWAALGAVGCAPGRGVVEVTLASSAPIAGIDHFQVRVTAPRAFTSMAVTPPGRPIAIPPALTFTLTFEAIRDGSLAIGVEARDAADRMLAEGSGAGEIRASERTAVRVELTPPVELPTADLGIPQDLSDADMSVLADLSPTD